MIIDTRFRAAETHRMVDRPSACISASSEERNWCGIYATAQHERPYRGDFEAVEDILLVHHRSGPVRIDRRGGKSTTHHRMPPGGIHLIPGGMDVGIRLHDVLDTLHVYIRRSILEDVAAELAKGDPALIELPATFIDTDPILQRILDVVAQCLQSSDPSTDLLAEDLARMIARRLVLAHSSASGKPALRGAGRIGPGPTISRAIRYMRENLDKSILLEDIARVTNFSSSHFSRLFRAEVGLPPHKFLLTLRLEEARRMLADTNMPIAEIAYACGFSHQEHMTRAFRATCDTTPGAYRRSCGRTEIGSFCA